MSWTDRTYVFGPAGQGGWMNSFAQVPTVLVREDVLRVYFTARPERNLSLIGYLDLDPRDPTRILHVHDRPILELGAPGHFDEFGLMPAAVVADGDRVRLYYTGWQRSTNVPYLNAVGLAESEDGGCSFRKVFPGPVMDRSRHFPISAMSPAILVEDGVWRCWYAAGTHWVRGATKLEPVYDVKYAHSSDGLGWSQPDVTCLASRDPEEALTRPAVVRNGDRYDMWYSVRRSRDFRGGPGGYRIALARSRDGLSFERVPDAVFDAGPSGGWDGEMTAYPCIVDTPAGRLMFYNGNDFGSGGFGFARWADG